MALRQPGKNEWVNYECGFPPACDAYINWLLMPKWERDPRTQADFARQHSVNPATLHMWRKDDRVRKELAVRADSYNLHPARIQEVMNALFLEATKGDVKAMSLFLQHAQSFMPTRKIIVENDAVEKMTDAELQQFLVDEGLVE